MLNWNLVRILKVLSSTSAFRRAGLESYTRWQVSSFDLKDGLYTVLWFKAVPMLMPVWRARENVSQMLMLCVSSLSLLLCPPLLSERLVPRLPPAPGLILTPEQQSQTGRLSAVYFVSICPPRPQGQNANTHTHARTDSFTASLTQSPPCPCWKWMYDILPFTIHISVSLSQQCDA